MERRIPPKRKPENWKPENSIGLCGEVRIYKKQSNEEEQYDETIS